MFDGLGLGFRSLPAKPVQTQTMKADMTIVLLLLMTVLATGVSAETTAYEIRPAPESRFALEVFKTGLMNGKKHLFLFERFKGKLLYDRQAPENSKVELTIESASAVCKDTWVSPKDLKKVQEHALKEMLAAHKYPEIRFVSQKIRRTSEGTFDAQGALTIREIDKPVTVSVTMKPSSTEALSLIGKAQVRMKDYGLNPPSAALGLIGAKDEMQVEFAVSAAPLSSTK